MTAPSTPGPDEPGTLSSQERAILDGIDRDLTEADPHLAQSLTRPVAAGPHAPTFVKAMLVLALVIVVVAAVSVPATWWPLLAALAFMVATPWLVLGVIERGQRPDQRP